MSDCDFHKIDILFYYNYRRFNSWIERRNLLAIGISTKFFFSIHFSNGDVDAETFGTTLREPGEYTTQVRAHNELPAFSLALCRFFIPACACVCVFVYACARDYESFLLLLKLLIKPVHPAGVKNPLGIGIAWSPPASLYFVPLSFFSSLLVYYHYQTTKRSFPENWFTDIGHYRDINVIIHCNYNCDDFYFYLMFFFFWHAKSSLVFELLFWTDTTIWVSFGLSRRERVRKRAEVIDRFQYNEDR